MSRALSFTWRKDLTVDTLRPKHTHQAAMEAQSVDITLPNGVKYTQPTGLFIDNKFVDGTGEGFTVFNPA